MKNSILIILLSLAFMSCGHTKYACYFEKGKNIDFSKGKWILNKPYTNDKTKVIESISIRDFKKILKDSLFEIDQLRKNKLIGPQLPFTPSIKNLKDYKLTTGCDYLINIKSNVIKNEMGSFVNSPSYGVTTKTNQAESSINIYDLNKLTLISSSKMVGKAEVTTRAEDDNFNYVNNGITISRNSLSRLIRKYKKNSVKVK